MEGSNSCIYLQDRALSTYLYINNYQEINLGKKELEKDFLGAALTQEAITSLSDIYLNVLKTSELEKFEGLKHGDSFDLDEVVDSLSRDLRNDFQKYGIIFFLLGKKTEKDYLETNPLNEIIDKPFMQAFFNGLNLSYSERVLFVLGIAQEEWGWLFPDLKNEEYKATLFCHICGLEKKDIIAYSRKMNSNLIQLGLFSAPWKISSYVYSYFKNETPAFTLQLAEPLQSFDFYDYKALEDLNYKSADILMRIKGFVVISSGSDFRNKYFMTDYYDEYHSNIYELKQEYKLSGKAELEFYIYVLSLQIRNGALFINESLSRQLINDDYENPIEEMLHKKQITSTIPEKVKEQVILSFENFTEEERSSLLTNGIDVLYTLNLKLPGEKNYKENLGFFCFHEHTPLKFLKNEILETCEKLEIQPYQWKSVANLFKKIADFSQEEAIEIIKNKFIGAGKSDKLRKNSHYCIEALNTTEPICEVSDALKNADEYQNGQYDEESGIKVLLYGISGGGKTAYAEEVAKNMNRSLKIVRPSEVLSKWVGETEQNISKIFKDAAKNHSILLVDEADSFLHNRGDSVNHFEDSKVNSFLIEIERYPGILFCSTNLPDILDKAVDRRFNFKVGFKSLTKEGVGLLCQSYFSFFELDENQVSKIYNSGEVTPGDFAALNGKLRFIAPEKRNAVYITEELCKIIHDKKRSYESNKIGFGN